MKIRREECGSKCEQPFLWGERWVASQKSATNETTFVNAMRWHSSSLRDTMMAKPSYTTGLVLVVLKSRWNWGWRRYAHVVQSSNEIISTCCFTEFNDKKTNKQINKEWTKILSARAVRWLSYYFGLCDRCCHGLRVVTKYTPRARLACPLSLPRAGVYCLRHYSQSNVSTAFIVARPISFRSNTTFWLVKQSFFGEER